MFLVQVHLRATFSKLISLKLRMNVFTLITTGLELGVYVENTQNIKNQFKPVIFVTPSFAYVYVLYHISIIVFFIICLWS